ncbi:flagellar biosynthesis protein FlhB [Luteimonas wenzhouensis]|jgi:flagellar biosynthetic protein FlhB|uniref:Flagellar biosynthetic protein FlhB n=1 Tax=Luteimonas wenzhouensis TaxID=2599615 RepID=A0A5C5TWJ2_9GAMM|nr:flagellar biosynthesis protein FlhB [Luteimonas wenzhouensis]NLW95773.1 flagellar biosynthesis protein FlhB [Xanthomonadaceae bacterium]TWT18017.1 flagellar biosynthesis protein FlhB [Luteimonas wenzhouensis]
MSEQPQKEDRTERPSEKRLRDAREKGQVPRSRELANVAVLGCAVLALKATGGYVGAAARDWMKNALTLDPALLGDPDRILVHSLALARDLFVPVLPLLAVALAACAISPAAMGGLRFASQALKPDFARLNPQKGLARMYGSESLAELLRSLLRVALIGGVGGWVVWRAFAALLALPQASLEASVAGGVDLVLGAVLAMVGSLLLLAAIDVPWQHFQHRNKLKMTKQEVRDEHKELEGNPEVKAKVRQVARQLSQRRMMDAVPAADVVVVNPTHYAVAMKYKPGMRAPVVVARGVDELALAIRAIAEKHRVAIVEAPPLARALYRMAQVDQEIPVKLYAAVAQVLSYVYQLRAWVPGRGPMPELAPLDVGAEGAPDPADGDGSPAR